MIGKKLRRGLKKAYSILIRKKQKNVLKIPLQLRLGNLLYFYLHCHKMKLQNKEVYILHTETMDYWLKYFPNLKDFVLHSDDFKFYDNLDYFSSYYQNFGIDFNINELTDFINQYILTESFFKNFAADHRTVINIRRGDFYSSEKKSPSEFDQIQYVKRIFKNHPELLTLPVFVISDDISWCQKELYFLEKVSHLHFLPDNKPIDDFIAISTAKNLIVTNSTFSYWGGYISKVINKENLVIAPNFGATFYKDSIAIQLHSDWKIEDIIN